jgi:Ca2+-binding RTX toxin-like protein
MFEQLEQRLLLSTLKGGILKITGTNRSETINVSQRKTYIFVQMNGKQEKFKLRSIKQVLISGGKGNDDIETAGKLPGMNISGGAGNDTIVGASGADVIHGDAGKDLIYGLGGNDQLFGDVANDAIAGGDGNDIIDGGIGNDSMTGEGGNDTVHGSDGDDWISAGNECLWGTEHEIHTCFAIAAGSDDDLLYGDAGNDHLFASKGMDTVSGGEGDDFFIIENNPPALAAVIDGGNGKDTIGKTGSGTQVSNVEIFTQDGPTSY